ncbi:hypothetical protein BNNNBJKE_00057 [Aeromonas phage vB_AdhM_DL]|nr:hypothetical protein BNCALIDO_00113 [Aeromonas phage vB_AdhM_TS9]WBF79641.1 hypothetical protein BNNNBJKE_00057 [Aeromonas phage vB_AdhM_DL]
MTFKIQDTNGKGLPDFSQEDLPLADITVYIHDSMMFATHDYPCPVCKVNSAVYNISNGIFQPCWDCQKTGYKIVKVTRAKS